ncbi:hypothetical protein [Streptomyces sp. PU-14G]|uniref:hypothetical protein n=1 Tax=Streptomyces sp. PU-14G TaxID=2800808 RepID=UPI0034E050DF
MLALIAGFVVFIFVTTKDLPPAPRPPQRPKGMSKQVWNRQQKDWREYKRKHGIDRSGGAGYSGGTGEGGGEGGD